MINSMTDHDDKTGPARTIVLPEPRFFTTAEFATLEAVCARLIPQPDREHPIDLAGSIDQRLAAGKGNGWRYDSMPPDPEAFRRAIHGLNEAARALVTAVAGHSVETRFESGSKRSISLSPIRCQPARDRGST